MPKPWGEVASSPEFAALPEQERIAARRQYFDQVVAPRVPQGELDDAWSQFETSTADSISTARARGQAIDAAARFNTKLSPDDEVKFRQWKEKNAPNDSGEDYDLRGAFKAGVVADAKTGHWPDTYKKPNHPTFSDQSQYAAYGNPGRWDGDKFIPANAKAKRTLDQPLFDDGELQDSNDGPVSKAIDYAKGTYLGASLKSGVENLAGTAAKIVDTFNPFTLSEQDAAVLYKNDPEGLRQMRDSSPAMLLGRFARNLQAASEESMRSISPEAKKDYGNLEYATTDPSKAAWLSPVKMVGDAVQSLPTTLALAVSAYFTKNVSANVFNEAIKQGATKEAARELAIKAAAETMAKTGAATEGAAGFGQQANQTRESADRLPMETIKNTDEYKSLIAAGFSPEAARSWLSAVASDQAGAAGGIADAVTNFFGGKVLGRVIGEGGKLAARSAKGFAAEAITEAVQSGLEQLGQNQATKQYLNKTQEMLDGVAENVAQGFFVGGLTGGVAGAIAGRGDTKPVARSDQPVPAADVLGKESETAPSATTGAAPPPAAPAGPPEGTTVDPESGALLADPRAIYESVTRQPAILQTISQAVAEQPSMPAEVKADAAAALRAIEADPKAIFGIATQRPDIYNTLVKVAADTQRVARAGATPATTTGAAPAAQPAPSTQAEPAIPAAPPSPKESAAAAFDAAERAAQQQRDREMERLAAEASAHRQDETLATELARAEAAGSGLRPEAEVPPTPVEAALGSERIFGRDPARVSTTGLQMVARMGQGRAREAAIAELARRQESGAEETRARTRFEDEGGPVNGRPLYSREEAFQRLQDAGRTSRKPFIPKRVDEADVPSPLRRAASLIANSFGKQVVFVSADPRHFDGTMLRDDPGTVYINVRSNRAWRRVVGHETLHTLRRTNRKVYDALSGRLDELVKSGALDFYKELYHDYDADIQREEMVADIFGDMMDSPRFWFEVFKATERNKVRALVRSIQMAFDLMRMRLRIGERRVGVTGYNTQGRDGIIRDIEAARKALARAYADWQAEADDAADRAQPPTRGLVRDSIEYLKMLGSKTGERVRLPESVGMLNQADLKKAEKILQSNGWYPNHRELLASQVQRDGDGNIHQVRMPSSDGGFGRWYAKRGSEVLASKPSSRDFGRFVESLPKDKKDRIVGSGGMTSKEVWNLVRRLEASARAGRESRGWYRESAREILRAFKGSKLSAERFAQLIAITSAHTEVKPNFTAAEKALVQYARGEPIHVGVKSVDEKANDLLYFGVDWEGRKTNNFYTTIMAEIGGETPTETVVDMHHARDIVGHTSPSPAEYNFIDQTFKFVAARMGWPAHETQAAIWVTTKARYLMEKYKRLGWHSDKSLAAKRRIAMAEAAIHYGDLARSRWSLIGPEVQLRETSKQTAAQGRNVTAEVKPSTKLDIGKAVAHLSMAQAQTYQKEAFARVFKGKGPAALMEAFDLDRTQYRIVDGAGGYDGATAPNAVITLNTDAETALRVAKAWMYIFRQDAVPYFRADPKLTRDPEAAQGVKITFSERLSNPKLRQVFDAMRAEVHPGVGFTRTGESEIAVINFRGEDGKPFLMEDRAFLKALKSAFDRDALGVKIASYVRFGAETQYPFHDWQDDGRGDGLLDSASGGGRPDLQERLRRWADVFGRYAEGRAKAEGRKQGAGAGEEVGPLFSRPLARQIADLKARYNTVRENQKYDLSKEVIAISDSLGELAGIRDGGKRVFEVPYIVGTLSTVWLKSQDQHVIGSHHGVKIPVEIVNDLDDMLKRPLAVYRASERNMNKGSYVVILKEFSKGVYAAAALDPDGRVMQTRVNFMASLHPRTASQIATWEKEGLRVYGAPVVAASIAESPGVKAADSGSQAVERQAKGPALIKSVSLSRSESKTVDEAAHEAATSPHNELPQPTDAQKEAGNYKKGHVRIAGMPITIENPAGSRRRPDWPVLTAHYGYIKGTEDRTGEHIDVFVKPGIEGDYEGPVTVVDTDRPSTRRFDEYKVMIGWTDPREALDVLRENYSADVRDKIVRSAHVFSTPEEFKRWLDNGDTKKPTESGMLLSRSSSRRSTRIEWAVRPRSGTWVSATADGRYTIVPEKGGFWAMADGEALRWDKTRSDAVETLNDRLLEDIAEGTVKNPNDARTITNQYRPEAVERVVDGWKRLARAPLVFRTATSTSKKIEEVFDQIDGGRGLEKVVQSINLMHADPAGATWAVLFRNGKTAFVNADFVEKTAYVEASDFDKGSQMGSFLYPAAITWARNNGLKLVPDPAGLSSVNTYRRTEQMLSAALKYGETWMLSPHEDQGLYGWNEDPQDARDDEKNIAIMALTSMQNTFSKVPDAIIYNFKSRRFETMDGDLVAKGDLQAMAMRPVAREWGIGPTTIARAIFTKSLIDETPGAKEFLEGKIAPSLLVADDPREQMLMLYSLANERFAPKPASAAKKAAVATAKAVVSATSPVRVALDAANSVAELAAKVPGRLIAPITSRIYDRVASGAERFFKAGEVRQQIAHGLTSDYGLPEPYVDQRDTRDIEIQKHLRRSKELVDQIAGLTPAEPRVAYQWMQEKPNEAEEQRLLSMLPDGSKQALARMKEFVTEMGREAVALGLLSEETFQRNNMAYLHRSYKKYEIENPDAVARAGVSKSIKADNFKGRGLRDDVAASRIPGAQKGDFYVRMEQRDPAADGALGRLRRVVYLPTGQPIPAAYSAWRNDGVWEVRFTDKKDGTLGLWRDLTKEERERLGEIEDVRYAFARTMISQVHDVETARFLKWVGETYSVADADAVAERGGRVADASDNMVTLKTYADDEWVQVPGTMAQGTRLYKYGLIQSRYIPGHIWNDIRSTINFRSSSAVWRLYDDLLRAWKISKTGLSPAVHTNNIMANFILADLAEVRHKDLAGALRTILDAEVGNEEARAVLTRYLDSGAELGTPALHELRRDVIEPLLAKLQGEQDETLAQASLIQAISLAARGNLRQAWAALSTKRLSKVARAPFEAMLEAYQLEDSVFRFAKWLKETGAGKTDREAGKEAREAFLDYRINAPWIQALRRGPFPFLAFTYRVVPILAETLAKKPWKVMKYSAVAYGVNALAYAMLGLSGDDEDKERKLLPDEKSGGTILGVPRLLRMPWNDGYGSPVFLDIRRWIPGGDIFDVSGSHGAIPTPSWLSLGGFWALGMELASNKNSFTGKEIWKESDTTAEAITKTVDHVFKFFAPNLPLPNPIGYAADVALTEKGLLQTYSWRNIQAAGTGATDDFGRELSPTQALAGSVGVKVGSYPADQLAKNLKVRRDMELRDNSETSSKYRRELQRGGLTSEEFQKRMQKQNEKSNEIRRRYGEKLGLDAVAR